MLKNWYAIFFILSGSIFLHKNSFCQTEDELKEINKAEAFFKTGNYGEALKVYLPFLETLDETAIIQHELNYKVGFCYYASAPEDSFAVFFFQKYLEQAEGHFESYYFLGNIFSAAHQFDSAIFYYNKFKLQTEQNEQLSAAGLSESITESVENQIKRCELAKFLVQNPSCAAIESIPGGINSIYSEYAAVISPDETMMVFTRRSPETLGGRISDDGDFFEDIYMSPITRTTVPLETDEFGNAIGEDTKEAIIIAAPVNMGQSVNTEGHEGAIQFSADGTKLYIYRKSNIWTADKKKKQSTYITRNWKKAKRQKKIKGVLKQRTYEPSVCISPDGNVMYFSSERQGGMGGLDIYKSEKSYDGKWSDPVNLGEKINTPFDEDAPFIAPDGKTLYFSSKGHTNMGDYDIFLSEFNGESWSKPLNMGYPVNSASDDIFFTMTPSGTGYFSSDRKEGYGLMDIFKAIFPYNTLSKAEISGIATANDSTPAYANIRFVPEDNPSDSITVPTDSLTGNYFFPLQFGKKYLIRINDTQYEPYSDTLTVPELLFFCQQYQATKTIILNKIKDTVAPVVDTLAIVAAAVTDTVKTDSALTEIREPEPEKNIKKERTSGANNLMDPTGIILYRVQVGAHAHPLSKNIYEAVPNLQVVQFEDGITRYFSGAFSNMEEAKKRRSDMLSDGFEGAFIIPFKNGQRISSSGTVMEGKEVSNIADNTSANTKKSANPKPEKTAEKNSSIKFRVQIGTYKNEAPSEVQEKFSKLAKVEKVKTPEGINLYVFGNFSDYASAQKKQKELVAQGFTNAFVIGQVNKKIITAQEAIELLKKK